uniref:Uncharacterized protein n=1 Tax=Podarcis muralis TaxID=64176 RepID=A0A670I086_PODMU
MSYVFVNDSSQTNVPLLQACIDGDFNYSKRLLESGFDPNIPAARGNVDICQLLHKFGADLLATDYQGNTALHLCGHVDTIQFLVSNGLKIDICLFCSLAGVEIQHSSGLMSCTKNKSCFRADTGETGKAFRSIVITYNGFAFPPQ